MTLKVIPRLQAFSSAIHGTFVQYFTRLQLTVCLRSSSATAGLLMCNKNYSNIYFAYLYAIYATRYANLQEKWTIFFMIWIQLMYNSHLQYQNIASVLSTTVAVVFALPSKNWSWSIPLVSITVFHCNVIFVVYLAELVCLLYICSLYL